MLPLETQKELEIYENLIGEPCAVKVASTVLRGERGVSPLPTRQIQKKIGVVCHFFPNFAYPRLVVAN